MNKKNRRGANSRVLSGLDRFGKSTDLVNLEKESVAALLVNGPLDTDGVSNSQIVTNDLEVTGLVKVGPGFPVILGEGILNADNGVSLGKALIEISQFLIGQPLAAIGVRVLSIPILASW